jgi:uncharacterized membrane protein (UPF0127 family)
MSGLAAFLGSFACEPSHASDPTRYSKLEQTDVKIGSNVFRAWIARNDHDRAAGFMYVEPGLLETLPDGKMPAMLFIFPADQPEEHGFWMKNVSVPLDIAFVRSDKTIVSIRTMAAHDDRNTHPSGSYRYTLETKAGRFRQLNIHEGDTVDIPAAALNNVE